MATQIFVNLPVKDLNRSVEFFTKLGYTFNPDFTDENATCMVISDTIFVMLLREEFFSTFSKREICDTGKHIESIIALSAESKEEVVAIVQKAVEAGAGKSMEASDHGFMYQDSFEDLDGHKWEYVYMNMDVAPQQ